MSARFSPVFRQMAGRVMVLRGAARELWLVFLAKLLAITAYGVMNACLILWLSSDLGYSDVQAGDIVMLWSTLMTMATVMVGSLVDAIGLRRAFLLGISVCIFARGTMTLSTVPWLAVGVGLMALAVGEALMTPVMVAAVRRYATTAQRSLSFSIFYVMMNLGFLLGAYIFDHVRAWLGETGRYTLPLLGWEFSTYRVLFLISFLLTLPNLVLLYWGVRPGVEATDEGLKITPEQPKYADRGVFKGLALTVRDAVDDTVRIFAGLWRQPAFFKFLAFLTLVVAVRLIMYHMNYTYPKFGIRELGDGAPIGRLWAINQMLIIFLVPLMGTLTLRWSAYRVVTLGSAVAVAAVFVMALPPEWFAPLAQSWLGAWLYHGYLGLQGAFIHPYYVMIFLFVVGLSLGESLYSPRLYEYPAAIAPKGQEASYMSLSYLPFFVAKVFVGMSSGRLLEQYCPATGERMSWMLWTYIAVMAAVTPLGLIFFQRFIRVKEAGRTD
ncbi:MAG: MFS transporter [Verrucomicrobiae bacterium]|nr:MFS transporter [Verrucomicrobiae bacterium]